MSKNFLQIKLGMFLFIILIGALVYYGMQADADSGPLISPNLPAISAQTKASGCVAKDGLPDLACTPGAVFPEATKETVCTVGYTKTVRDVSTTDKNNIYASYGITSHKTGEYEVDHQVPLELGGSNEYANLWPEAAEPVPGCHEKDIVENYLHAKVCDGTISLSDAQKQIAFDWRTVYNKIRYSQDATKYKYTAY
jgi:hypothetical protein